MAIKAARLSVDWWRVITDLNYCGYSTTAIGVSLSVPSSTVRTWRGGASPRHECGEALIDLWASVTQKSRDSVPRVRL